MKRLLIILLFIFLIPAASFSDEKDIVSFDWSIVKLNKENFLEKYEDTKGQDKVKFYFRPINNAYIYLFHIDSENKLTILFPSNFSDYKKNKHIMEKFHFPEKDNWFEINKKDKLILLVSSIQLIKLQKAAEKYLNYLMKNNNRNDINKEKQNVINEIQKLKQENSKFVIITDTPISYIGITRNNLEVNEENIEKLAHHVESKKFYQQTIRITK